MRSSLKTVLLSLVVLAAACAAFAQVPSLSAAIDKIFTDGVAAYKAGNYDAAIERYSAFLRSRPNDHHAWYNRGLAYFKKAEYAKAAADFSKAVSIDAKYVQAFTQRARTYNELAAGDPQRYSALAVADLTKAISLRPNGADLYRERAEVYLRLGDNAKALADLSNAIRLDPKSAESFYLRGKIKFDARKYTEADADLRAAVRLKPGHSAATDLLKKNSAKLEQARTPQPKPKPSRSSTTAAMVVPTGDLSTDGDKYLAAGQPDLAIAAYEREFAKMAAADSTTPGGVSVLFANQKAAIKQKIAKAYFQKREYQVSMTTCADLQKELLTHLVNAYNAIDHSKIDSVKYVETAKIQIDMVLSKYDLLEDVSKRAESIADGCIDIYSKLEMLDDPKFQRIGIGMGRAMIAELVAGMFGEASELNFAMLKFCNGNATRVCGPRSNKNQTAKYQKRAFEYVNAGIAMFPNLRKNFARRAELYRYLGQNALAAADEARANGGD